VRRPRNRSGSLATFTAIRLASSRVSKGRTVVLNRPSGMEVAFGHVGTFSQVSVVFEQENPVSLDYMRRAVGPAIHRPMPVHVRPQAAWERRPVADHCSG
jgi:hypothetical protein